MASLINFIKKCNEEKLLISPKGFLKEKKKRTFKTFCDILWIPPSSIISLQEKHRPIYFMGIGPVSTKYKWTDHTNRLKLKVSFQMTTALGSQGCPSILNTIKLVSHTGMLREENSLWLSQCRKELDKIYHLFIVKDNKIWGRRRISSIWQISSMNTVITTKLKSLLLSQDLLFRKQGTLFSFESFSVHL